MYNPSDHDTTAASDQLALPLISATSSTTAPISAGLSLLHHSHQQQQHIPHDNSIAISNSTRSPWPGHISAYPDHLRHYTSAPSLVAGRLTDPSQLYLQQASSNVNIAAGLSPLASDPAILADHLYNEQLLRAYGSGSGVKVLGGLALDPRIYENVHSSGREMQFAAHSNSALSRTFDSLGRSVGPAASACKTSAESTRYEEVCTPRPRWCPTQEQIQILESLFNSGTTTPSRDMIVDIAAQLRKYGNIAEANVFYWFQNRKARAKRKLQSPSTASTGSATAVAAPSSSSTSVEDQRSTSSDTPLEASGYGGESQNKARRIGLKPSVGASSPISSGTTGSPTERPSSSSTRLQMHHHQHQQHQQQQPMKLMQLNPSSTSSSQQESLLLSNNLLATNQDVGQQQQQFGSAAIFPWPIQQRLPEDAMIAAPDTGYGGIMRRAGSPAMSNTQFIDHRISLSLAPPAHQPASASASSSSHAALQTQRTSAAGHGHNHHHHHQQHHCNYIPSSDQQFLQATSKGLVFIDPRETLNENPIMDSGAATSVNPPFFSQMSASNTIAGRSGVEFSEQSIVSESGGPQSSSLPLARTVDAQQPSSARLCPPSSVPSLPEGEDQLQLWEELDSCGNLTWGNQNQQ